MERRAPQEAGRENGALFVGVCFTRLWALIFVSLLLVSCRSSVLRRPYGDLRLGKVADLLAPDTFIEDDRLLVRHDAGGFSVMSTMCTYDLSPLTVKTTPQGKIWASAYSTSTYSYEGKVLTGPAKGDLPYYELRFDAMLYGGPVDTLYASVGTEKPPEWRLSIPVQKK